MENLCSEDARENSQRSSWDFPKSKNDCVARGMARRGEGMRKEHPSGLAMGTWRRRGGRVTSGLGSWRTCL